MPKQTKPKTNVDNVIDLMTHGPTGALIQPFVITAIEKYAKQCIEAGPTVFDSSLLNGQAWIRTAEYAQQWATRNYP